MTLNELKADIDLYVEEGFGDWTVLITLSEPSIGAGVSTGIHGIYPGIDWEHGQMRIDPEEPIVRRGRAKSDAMPINIWAYSGPRKFYTCPICDNKVTKYNNYCSHCGQLLEYDPDAEPIDSWRANYD